MSFFNIFNQKNTEGKVHEDNHSLMQFERDLTQEVAITMFNLKITKQPSLNFLHNDCGIFEGTFISHTTDEQLLMISQQSFNTYLMVLGCHAFGTAAYVVMSQNKYKKPVNEYSEIELREIAQTIAETDAYEVGLNALGFKLDGNNKKCVDHIVQTAMTAALRLAGANIHDKRYQKVYMKVLYNAGVTIIYGR